MEKGNSYILPCAGITLIRFTGMISDCLVILILLTTEETDKTNTPGTLKSLWQYAIRVMATVALRPFGMVKNWPKIKAKKFPLACNF